MHDQRRGNPRRTALGAPERLPTAVAGATSKPWGWRAVLSSMLLSRALLKPLVGTHIHAAINSAIKTLAAATQSVCHEYVQLSGCL
jgi:hypothetical protein